MAVQCEGGGGKGVCAGGLACGGLACGDLACGGRPMRKGGGVIFQVNTTSMSITLANQRGGEYHIEHAPGLSRPSI